MDLLDIIGGTFGGGAGGPTGLQDQMVAQLGGDPAAMRRQAALSSLGQLGATLLANSAPSTQRKSLASSLGQGMLAAQQGYGDAMSSQLNKLYLLENMKRASATDKRLETQDQQDASWRIHLQDPAWVKANLSERLQPYANVLAGMPMQQASQYILQDKAQEAAEAREDKRLNKPQLIQTGNGGVSLWNPSNPMDLATLREPRAPSGGAGQQVPWWFQRLTPEQQSTALEHVGGLDKSNARVPASVLSRTAMDAQQLNASLPAIDTMLANIDRAEELVNRGVQTGSAFGGLTNYQNIADAMPQLLTPDQKALNGLVKQGIFDTAKQLPGSFSNKEGAMAAIKGFNLANDKEANLAAIARMRQNTQLMRAHALSRLDWYNSGDESDPHTVLNYRAPSDPGFANVQGGGKTASTQRPAGLPANAKQAPDGRWYDPATKRFYVEQ